MKRDLDEGRIHPALASSESFVARLQEMTDKYKYVTWSPPHHLSVAWDAFKAVRNTKGYDHPITFQDLWYYCKMQRLELTPSQSTLIMRWDQVYYSEHDKRKD